MSSLSFVSYSIYNNMSPNTESHHIYDDNQRPSLGYHTNNKYPTFPPLMMDGRAICASYQPEAVLNKHIIESNNIQSNWQYRKYLTKNAVSIMNQDFTDACNDAGYYKRYSDIAPINQKQDTTWFSHPYLYESVVDTDKPKGYITSDLKDAYLSREQLNAKKISPVITQEQLINR